jgi:hypothetical protein
MAAEKRQLSHPNHKWEEMRLRITRLYQDEHMHLKDIIKMLADQGFVAKYGSYDFKSHPLFTNTVPRECHYKTRIRKWGLDNKYRKVRFAQHGSKQD